MTLAVTIGSAVLVLGFALMGALRDLPRGVLALTGVLFGTALVSLWGMPFAQELGRRFGNTDTALLQRFASIVLFGVSTLLGVGSGMLLPHGEGTLVARLVGGLLGVFTGALAAGFVLNYAGARNEVFVTDVRASPIGAVLHDRLPLLLLAGAGVVLLAIILRLVVSLLANRTSAQATPSTTSSTSTGAAPAQAAKVNDQGVLNKIREQTGEAAKR